MHGLNQFALVIYVPDPLGRFLDDLRVELAPGCKPHAHVTVLPPRPLSAPWAEAAEQARAIVARFPPFDIEAGGIRIFPTTDVIYIEVGRGATQLRRMHAALNAAALPFEEPYPYHPHFTLVQDMPRGDVPDLYRIGERRWGAYTGPRVFRAETAVFVQNTLEDVWIDLAEFTMEGAPVESPA